MTALAILVVIMLVLVAAKGLHDVAQTGLNGLTLGVIYALGAVGLTLVYGILKLVNFAHGDFLTFGAYMAFLVNVTWGAPLVVAVFWAMVATALLGVLFERLMWGPMRAKRAGLLQLLLMSIGLAFVIRSAIQWFWGTEIRRLDVNVIDTVSFLGLQHRPDRADRRGRRDRRDGLRRADAALQPARQADAGPLRRPRPRRDRRHRHPAGDPLHLDVRRRAGRASPACSRAR